MRLSMHRLVSGLVLLLLTPHFGCGKKDKSQADLSVWNGDKEINLESTGKLTFGATRSIALTIKNHGEQAAEIGALVFKNTAGSELDTYKYTGGTYPGTDGTCATSIPGESSCTISLTFADPRTDSFAANDYEVTALLTYKDEAGTREKQFKAGILLPAFLQVKHEARKLSAYNFGGRAFGGTRTAKFSLVNTGEMAATVTALAFKNSQGTAVTAYGYTGGTYPGTGGSCGATIAASSTCSISLDFTAPSATAYAATEYAATATIDFKNGVEAKKITFSTTGTATQCASGSGLSIEQLTIDTGSAASSISESQNPGQSFTFPEQRIIKKVRLSQYKGAGATFSGVRLSFFEASSGSPATTASKTYDFSDPGIALGSRGYFTYSLATPFIASATSTYWISVSYLSLAGGTMYTDRQTVEAESTGSYYYYNGTTWSSSSTSDLTFGLETCLVDSLAEASATYAD